MTKRPFFLLLFTLFCCIFVDGKTFRFDYKYYPVTDGWLKLHRVPANWYDARLRCHLEGAVLASPLNEHLLAALTHVMESNQVTNCGVYTGINAIFSRGDFVSVEGVPLNKIPITWAPDEPDNHEEDENCLILIGNGTMADVKCTEVFPYVCYKKKSKNMVLTGCGTVDKEYALDTRTGNCYKFHSVPETWSRAYMTCTAEGGYLAIINSPSEAKIVTEIYAKHPVKIIPGHTYKDIILIGFHDWTEHGSWLTVHGETLDEAGYNVWANGQPDNASLGEFCGSIFPNGLLNDVWCYKKFPYLCEKSPISLLNSETDLGDQ